MLIIHLMVVRGYITLWVLILSLMPWGMAAVVINLFQMWWVCSSCWLYIDLLMFITIYGCLLLGVSGPRHDRQPAEAWPFNNQCSSMADASQFQVNHFNSYNQASSAWQSHTVFNKFSGLGSWKDYYKPESIHVSYQGS